MKRSWFAVLACLGVLFGCGASPVSEDVGNVGRTSDPLAGTSASGAIPAGLPATMQVGLFEDTGDTWMKSSGVPWSTRYRYFTKGWVNNWGYGSYDGTWGLQFLQECATQGYIPAVQYYQIVDEAGGSESAMLSKVQNATTMRSYFGDFKIFMQRVKDFGKPVVVMLEADGFGFLEQQSNDNPNAPAAIASTGMAELAGLPNTVAGWGLAFLQIRKAVGATNAILGVHVSDWASGKDLSYVSVTDSLGPEVNKVYSFLSPLGLGTNVTGKTYDFLVGDPLDRDSDYYRITQNLDRWWDASDTASISSKSFNRYAEWLRLWNVKANRRWILWQIPLGNSNQKNVDNNGSPSQGYKDNRPEYFFGSGTAHISKFADVGVIGLLFGAGATGQSSYQNDQYTDGQLFMKTRAGAILKAGGVPLSTGSGGSTGTGGATGAGGVTGAGGTTGMGGVATGGRAGSGGTGAGGASSGGATSTGGTGGGSADPAQYSFETGNHSWRTSGGMLVSDQYSTDHAFAGTHSLKVNISGPAGDQTVSVASPTVTAGKTITFHVFIPAGSAITSIQPYALQGASGGWTWTGSWQAIGSLAVNQWNTITVKVPTNAVTPLSSLGVEVTTNASYTGAMYIDSVGW
ncbi:MAG TPA: hypothetical protein VH062_13345 [Polyangiaceae bacterium]|nr:hypothetical protein [Polyangiaceae bacterium]